MGGGRTRRIFLDQGWKLTVSADELNQSVSKENLELKQQVQTLESQLQATNRILRNSQIQPSLSSGHKRTRTAKHYS